MHQQQTRHSALLPRVAAQLWCVCVYTCVQLPECSTDAVPPAGTFAVPELAAVAAAAGHSRVQRASALPDDADDDDEGSGHGSSGNGGLPITAAPPRTAQPTGVLCNAHGSPEVDCCCGAASKFPVLTNPRTKSV